MNYRQRWLYLKGANHRISKASEAGPQDNSQLFLTIWGKEYWGQAPRVDGASAASLKVGSPWRERG